MPEAEPAVHHVLLRQTAADAQLVDPAPEPFYVPPEIRVHSPTLAIDALTDHGSKCRVTASRTITRAELVARVRVKLLASGIDTELAERVVSPSFFVGADRLEALARDLGVVAVDEHVARGSPTVG